MRRVDEAVREVLSDAITQELKDPRVGFVTVTAVETSPDLRHARVFVSVLGDDAAAPALDGRPALRARLPAAPRRHRADAQAHADARLPLRRLRRPRRCGSRSCSRRRARERQRLLPRRARCCSPSSTGSERFLLATHENPDGDALGSLAGDAARARRARQGRGHLHGAGRVPAALRVPLHPARRASSPSRRPTSSERTIVFLDCGNIDRNPADSLKREGAHILNIDHHHDNTRFGTVNHVVPDASCTAEIVWDLMKARWASRPTQPIAEALYVGLVTDTGKFMYENTGPRAHQMAADLIEAGVDVQAIYRRLFEGVPQGKLELLARGLANVERFDDGLLTLTHLSARRLRGHGRRRVLLRGRRRPPARARGHGGRRARARPAAATASSAARSRCAPPTTASTCPRSRAPRAAAAIAGPPASRPPWAIRSSSSSCAASLAEQL